MERIGVVEQVRIHRFFLFDSFAGLPPLAGPDAGSTQFRAGDYAFGVDDVVAKLRRHGISDDVDIVVVPGFFDRTLPGFDPGHFGGQRAAIVHIDVDLYQSCVEVLAFLTPTCSRGR